MNTKTIEAFLRNYAQLCEQYQMRLTVRETEWAVTIPSSDEFGSTKTVFFNREQANLLPKWNEARKRFEGPSTEAM